MTTANDLWNATSEEPWTAALALASTRTNPSRRELERELEDRLTPAVIAALTPEGWATFLRDKYFVWKYTAANRLATTRTWLARHVETKGVPDLDRIRHAILSPPDPGIGARIRAAKEIGGLGTAGASGLLALLYPREFGTVDQFIVTALRGVPNLPEREILLAMEPNHLTVADAVTLILILRRKATELKTRFGGTRWTPRMIDMALWAVGRPYARTSSVATTRPASQGRSATENAPALGAGRTGLPPRT